MTTTANSYVQLESDLAMRGRVMAIFLAVALGGTPLGAPIVGHLADRFGPRWGLGFAASMAGLATGIGLVYHYGFRKTPVATREPHSFMEGG